MLLLNNHKNELAQCLRGVQPYTGLFMPLKSIKRADDLSTDLAKASLDKVMLKHLMKKENPYSELQTW